MTSRIIAIANQKGGVGKTVTSINLAAALARCGKRVAIVDMDPQGNASTGLGVGQEARKLSTYDFLLEGSDFSEVMLPTKTEGLFVLPASEGLTSVDMVLGSRQNRLHVLKEKLNPGVLAKNNIDIGIIDSPPSLNLLTLNAIVCAGSILVPLQAEFFALEGLSQLILSIRQIREKANPDLRIEGVVLTMFDRRNNLALQVEEDARTHLGDLVFQTKIPRTVRLSEAPSHGQSIFDYDNKSKGAVAYMDLAAELLQKAEMSRGE